MKCLCWMRRDLRLHDHVALSKSLDDGETTLVFVFDTHILDKLKDKNDRRVSFIIESLREIESKIKEIGSSIIIRYGKPEDEIPKIAKDLKVQVVYCNRDYEPYAKERDAKVSKKLQSLGIEFDQFKDHVIYEKEEVKTGSDETYKVFTPYKNKWLENFINQGRVVSNFSCELNNLRKFKNSKSILSYNWYQEIGFVETPPLLSGGTSHGLKRLKDFEAHIHSYEDERNYPAIAGTSLLSVYLRHGNISVRDMIRVASAHHSEGAKVWLSEIIWRDFYQTILDAFPHVAKEAFKAKYKKINYLGTLKEFRAWCQGETGYPLVDAAMRCLNQTGMMHNRLRMVVASFLCKTLLIDWRKGEEYFAQKLLDYDLAANNGGWQWVSGSGCDAQPYFRIFNPYTQSKKFDPDGEFIRMWIPELDHLGAKSIHQPSKTQAPDYPAPIVSYELSRQRCLSMYSVVKA